jgi:hypothetical protein
MHPYYYATGSFGPKEWIFNIDELSFTESDIDFTPFGSLTITLKLPPRIHQ